MNTLKMILKNHTSFEYQVSFHSFKAIGLHPPADHGVPHKALVAVDVHEPVVARDLRRK